MPLFARKKSREHTDAPSQVNNILKYIIIMTHTSLFSEFHSINENRSRKSFSSKNIYQVVIDGEDGEYADYEIEAKSEAEAAAIAEQLAAESMINIMYIEVNLYK